MKIKDAKWRMSKDEIGMEPKFRVWCKECFWAYVEKRIREMAAGGDVVDTDLCAEAFYEATTKMLVGEFDMFLREAFCSPLPTVGEKAFHNDMHYKCCGEDGCDQIRVFGVPIDEEYYNELMERRNGAARILPWMEWNKTEQLKRQLRSMGYL